MKLGIQLYTLREEMRQDPQKTLAKVKEIGFDGVETAGFFGHDSQMIKAVCRDVGLEIPSAHVSFGEFGDDPDSVFQLYRDMGCRYVALPVFHLEKLSFEESVRRLYALAEMAPRYGLVMMFHNHDWDLCRYDGKVGLDSLLGGISPDKLMAELDLGWVYAAGQDPASYIRKYAGRVPCLHFKDVYREEDDFVPYDRINEGKHFESGMRGKNFQIRALGRGLVPFAACADAARESGGKWVIYEQDMPAEGLSPTESAEISFRYLKQQCKF